MLAAVDCTPTQKDALVGYKRLAEERELDLRASTSAASTLGCRTLDGSENTSEVQRREPIPAITDSDVPWSWAAD